MEQENHRFKNNAEKGAASKLLKISQRLQKEIAENKRLEKELQSATQALFLLRKAHDKAEEELIEAYQHAGLINRKFSVLMDLDKNNGWEKKKDLIGHILRIAASLSEAEATYIYKYRDADRHFWLLDSSGVKKSENESIKILSKKGLPDRLDREKTILKGRCADYDFKIFNLKPFKYFLAIPLVRKRDNRLKGFLILVFSKEKNIDSKDLEFYDIFAMHAASALLNAGVLA